MLNNNIVLNTTTKSLVLKSTAALLTLTFLASSAYAKGTWRSFVDKDEAEAKRIATEKHQKYAEFPNSDFEIVSNFVKQNCPNLNPDMIEKGLSLFFEEKVAKWQRRSTLSGRDAITEISNSMSSKSNFNYEPESLETWSKTLTQASQRYPVLYFQYMASKGLTEVMKKARALLSPDEVENDVVMNLSYVLNRASHVRKLMNVENETKRFKNLHLHLSKKLRDLMGFEEDALQKAFEKTPIVKIIDPEYKKDNLLPIGMVADAVYRPAPFIWTKTEPINDNSHEWGHGDMMIGLVKNFAPLSGIHSYITLSTGDYDPLDFSRIDSEDPLIYNCSFIPRGVFYFLQPSLEGIKLDKTTSEALRMPGVFESWKKIFSDKFPDIELESVLSREQLEFLRAKEDENFRSKNAPNHAKDLVVGRNGQQTHMLMAAPSNDSGPLKHNEFHNGWIKLLNDKDTKDHALVALNYDFTTQALVEKSHSAGDYKDMAVVVPSTFVSVTEGEESLPYVYNGGGHSSATVILSSIVSHVRGHYPKLTHLQVREAILKGANRTFEGYKEELHGQGMVNLKGALQLAREMAALGRNDK